MIKQFIGLEWKQFKRSSYFQKGLAIKILMFLGVLYFGGIAVFLGGIAYFALKKMLPEQDPITVVNNFLIFWFMADLLLRFFMQQLPVMNVKPYMVIPVNRPTIIHYLLGRTSIHFFNFLSLLMFLPFSVVLIVQDYPVINVICWFIAMLSITLVLNFTNFLINKSNSVFYSLLTVLASFVALKMYNIFDVTIYFGQAFNALYNMPYLVLLPIALLVVIYKLNFNYVKSDFYLDGAISQKIKEADGLELNFLNRFGKTSTFLKNDIKLIMRNARPKQVMMMSFMFLFYGLVFYTQQTYKDMPAVLAFASIFITGGFLLSFGQLVPSWDSEYYKMLMSQNIPYRQYLESKWYLMVFAVFVSFILATPYLYFGVDIYLMILAGAFFNIGVNSFITLLGGALNRVPVELNTKAKAFSNTNGFNPTQLLIGLPKMLLPMLLFYVPYKLINFNAGLLVLGLSGVLGFVFKNAIFNLIERLYQKGKYKTIAAFSEKK